jgi:hypothetical protein
LDSTRKSPVVHAQTIDQTGHMKPMCGWKENPVTARDRSAVTCMACLMFLANGDAFARANRPATIALNPSAR